MVVTTGKMYLTFALEQALFFPMMMQVAGKVWWSGGARAGRAHYRRSLSSARTAHYPGSMSKTLHWLFRKGPLDLSTGTSENATRVRSMTMGRWGSSTCRRSERRVWRKRARFIATMQAAAQEFMERLQQGLEREGL